MKTLHAYGREPATKATSLKLVLHESAQQYRTLMIIIFREWLALDILVNYYDCFHCIVKVILIHAGGYSQRLPNQSVLGKVFLTLPCGKFQCIRCPQSRPKCKTL